MIRSSANPFLAPYSASNISQMLMPLLNIALPSRVSQYQLVSFLHCGLISILMTTSTQMLWHPDRFRTPRICLATPLICKKPPGNSLDTNGGSLPSCIWGRNSLYVTLALESLGARAKGMCIVSLLPPQCEPRSLLIISYSPNICST